jgi:hypothetical protein
MAMRFERRARPGRTEFWVFGVPAELQPALEHIWAGGRHGEGWCKSFDPAAYLADEAFANLQRLLVPALRQVAGLDPVPWADALEQTCRRLIPAGVDWWLAGSAALAVRGAPLTPGDLDLIVAGPDALRTGDLFADGLFEPVARGEWPISEWWGRALIGGARVEWAGGMTPAADEPDVSDVGLTAAAALDTVRWHGWDIRVPPLALQRAVSLRRGLPGRVAAIDRLAAAG